MNRDVPHNVILNSSSMLFLGAGARLGVNKSRLRYRPKTIGVSRLVYVTHVQSKPMGSIAAVTLTPRSEKPILFILG
jgi:hypothetical protein